MKEQAGDFHDLQLHFQQLCLIPLLLEPASFPDLLSTFLNILHQLMLPFLGRPY